MFFFTGTIIVFIDHPVGIVVSLTIVV